MPDQTSDARQTNQKFRNKRARRRWLKRHAGASSTGLTHDLRSGLEALEQRTLLSASPVFELSDLLAANGGNGSEGVVINGVTLGDRAGVSVSSAGDINGDGFDDIIVGAFRASPHGADSGASYVIFGKAGGFNATQQLSALNGTNGFKINGINAGDFSGRSVSSAGDINGDGFDDLLIGSFVASPNGAESGQVHVVYGKASGYTATLELSSLNGTNGFTINGVAAGDRLGFSVRGAGDVNGDGLDDFILGSYLASPNGNASGSAYLVFGQTGFGSSFNLATLNGTNGLRIDGVSADDQLGISANAAGDVNGDGLADIIVGAFQDDPNGGESGAAFVIFGKTSGFSATFNPNTLNGTNGFTLNGGAALDNAGRSVDTAGDFNGDGFADLLIGAPDANGTNADSGSAYIVFGHSGAFVSSINLSTLTGADGFKLNGIDTGDRTGLSVSSAGDVNGDGLDDVLVAADRGNPNGVRSGETYLVLGRSTAMPASINLSALNGADGFVLNGIIAQDSSGSAIRAAGDVNGDGFGDFIIGAFLADPNGGESGQSYLVFGGDFSDKVTHMGTSSENALVGTAGANVIVAGAADDVLVGDGGADILIAGQGNDEITIKDTTFKRIAGGNGTDTLKLVGTGITLDLTTIADSRLTGIEEIDISGGTNTLTLNQREVLNISDTTNTLTVTRNINGTVNMGSGWTQTDSQVVSGNQQTTYTQGRATLIVVVLADVIDPVVTINPLKTESRSPQLTGTVADLDPATTVTVTVNGNLYNATNNGNGTWTLPAGTITPDLADGVYSVLVVGTDSSGNDGTDQTNSELIIDNAAPVVTVNTLATSGTSPQLTGTVSDLDPATTISVTVNGNTYPATNNGNGTWTLAAGVISPALADGVYQVTVTGTDTLGHIGTDASTDELRIDTTAPVVTIDTPGTKDTGSPELTGTVTDADPDTLIEIAVNGGIFEAVNNGDGTWTLDAGVIDPALAEGSYAVDVRATDSAGNQAFIDEAVDLVIDGPPVVTINPLTTSDQTPQLTGTIVDADTAATVTVTVNGIEYTATNHGDGTWTLPDNTILPANALAPGTYDITVTATDSGNNVGTDTTTDELVIDITAPTVTINPLATGDTTPALSGTVSDAVAVIKVTVGGTQYAAVNNGDGTWTLPDNTITTPLAQGVYDVAVTATNQAQVPAVGSDNTTDELRIDSGNPVVTVNTKVTGDTTPSLSGTITDDDPGTTISVTIPGAGTFDAVNNGDGTWTLPDNTITPALTIGKYDIIVTALDSAQNIGSMILSEGLEITDAPFTITVDTLATNDSTPQITGTVSDANVTIEVTINGVTYAAVNNGTTWTLADNTITPALADGVYDVQVTGTNLDLVSLSDETTGELTIDTAAPVVTVDPLSTSDTNPQLTGTVNDPNATVSVTVNGNVYAATNNGDGTWTLADNAITPLLPVGTYNVQVAATDTVGNVGADATIDELIITNPVVPSIDLDDLYAANGGDGTEGVVFNGVAGGDWAGYSASTAGDINGDGFDDLVIGANNADPLSNNDGTVYVVFGQAGGFPAEFDLATLNGTNGFKINAQNSRDSLGVSVASAGDVNGDGLDDLVIGADLADPNGNRSGSAYVIYGKTTPFAATLDLATLNGTNGYKFNGAATDDRTGFSVNSAGDINGDGLADVVIGTLAADNGVVIDTGRAYVIYGSSAAMPAVLTPASLNGTNGFILTGPDTNGQAGFSVSTAGDINGDGIADLRIGAPGSTVGANAGAGKTFVVFGNTAGFGTELNLSTLNGTNGFVIEGNAADMNLGFSGSAIGDFNGDGFADLLVSAPASADPASAGSAYVIFGHAGAFPAALSVGSLNGTNGFALQGVDTGDETGFNVSGIGDVNGDGFDDLLIGAHMAAGGTFENGESYLLFGRTGAFAASIDLATIPGNGGMVFNGADVLDRAGRYVSIAGDVNGDGYADFLIGARDADVNGNDATGRTYLIFGRDFTGTVTQAGGATGDSLTGSAARDAVIAGAGDDTIVGNGGPDIHNGGQGDDTLAVSDTAFKRIAGGNGFDTLRIDGAGVNLDLTAISDSSITGIEQIDLRGSGANSLTLNAREVLNLSDTSNTLLVLSDSADTVDIGTGWTAQGQEQIGGKNFGVFTQGNATLKLYIESQALAGDLNGDNFVGIEDLNLVLANWNQNVTPGNFLQGDPTGDGFVGIEDLNVILGNWNAGTPPAVQATNTSTSSEQPAPATEESPAATEPAPVTQSPDPMERETSILDQVAPGSQQQQSKQQSQQQLQQQTQQQQQRQQSQSQSQAWAWMQDASRTQRSAFGDTADSDSALDLAQPADSTLSRLLN